MEEWISYKIGDLCDSISETYKRGSEKVVLINTSDVLEGKCENHAFVDNRDLKGQFKKTFQRDDILYSEIRPANKRFAYIDFDATDYIASTKLMVIRSNGKVLPRFLYHHLKNQTMLDELQALAESRSGTFPQITFSELANLEIPVPPVNAQEKIVRFIDTIEDKININNRINHNLEEQAKALYKSWFVDFDPFKDGKFVESELGMIPDGWRVGTMNCLLEIKYGKDHKKLSDGLIPVYGSGGFMRYVNQSIYTGESVLIPRKGTLNNVMYVNEAFWTVDTMFYSVQKIQHTVKYCYHILSSLDLSMMNAGSAVPSMTTDILNSIKVIIPDENALANFDLIMSSLYQRMLYNNNETHELVATRDSLLPKLMSGELSVNKIDC